MEPVIGTPVVAGLAYGPIVHARHEIDPARIEAFGATALTDPEQALARYDEAVRKVVAGFEARAAAAEGPTAEVLTATAALARDRGLRGAVRTAVRAQTPLLDAVAAAVDQFATTFAAMGGLMAERVTDLRDIGRRITARLVGADEPGVPAPEVPSILVAEDLSPADTAGLDPDLIIALVTHAGGPTSHTAIIARQLGIPCVVGARGVLDIPAGTFALVDGEAGSIDPTAAADTAHVLVADDVRRRAELVTWQGPGRTVDGHPIRLLANVADPASANEAAAGPVEGIGLFRTELGFLDRREEPTVAEQTAIYAEVLEPFGGGGHVVIRTLDAGSDKPLAYATRPDEQNPALGVRGLRLSFDDPGLLERQLDAIAAAAERVGATPWVMAPMVATVAEAAGFAERVRARGLVPGAMVEVPSAAILAGRLLEVVDFLSVGTNDLTQYTMAADRMASELAALTDPWQPAVLRLIAMAAEAGTQAAKPVGVCGEAAADPLLAVVLVGLGITSLSMATSAVRAVGARLGTVDLATGRKAAHAALAAADPTAARAAVRALLAS